MYVKKIHQFLSSIEKMHTEENWFIFSASRWIYADGCWNVGYPWFQRLVCVDWGNVVTTRRRRTLFCVWMCIVMQTYHVATVAYQQIIPNLTEYYRLRIISVLLLRYSYSSIPGTWYVFVTIRPHHSHTRRCVFPLKSDISTIWASDHVFRWLCRLASWKSAIFLLPVYFTRQLKLNRRCGWWHLHRWRWVRWLAVAADDQ